MLFPFWMCLKYSDYNFKSHVFSESYLISKKNPALRELSPPVDFNIYSDETIYDISFPLCL
jgi:hypothetical protein